MNSTEQYEMRKLFREFIKAKFPRLSTKEDHFPTLQEIILSSDDSYSSTDLENWFNLTHRPTSQKDVCNP